MCLEVSPDGIAIPGEARADEAFVVVQHRDAAGRAVAHEQVGDLGDAFLLGDLVERALREARIPRRSGVRIRAARQRPFGERKIAFLDRRLEDKTRTGSVAPHIEHRPVGIVPRDAALGLHGVRVNELEPPEDVSAEVRVVEHLDVERFGTVLEKEREILGGIRLARRVLLAFTRDAREGGIPGIAGHVEVVRIGAVLEEDSTDGDAVLEDVPGACSG